MTLTRGRIVGHDTERLAFGFTMQNEGETVQCQISDAAMDELAGVKGTESLARQAQFLACAIGSSKSRRTCSMPPRPSKAM